MAPFRSDRPGAPANGDMLIVKDTDAKRTSYVLSVVPNPGQIRCQTYEQAVATVSQWASLRKVAIWFSENGRTFAIVSPTLDRTLSRGTERAHDAE